MGFVTRVTLRKRLIRAEGESFWRKRKLLIRFDRDKKYLARARENSLSLSLSLNGQDDENDV